MIRKIAVQQLLKSAAFTGVAMPISNSTSPAIS